MGMHWSGWSGGTRRPTVKKTGGKPMGSLRTFILLVCASAGGALPAAAHAELRIAFGYTDFYNRAILEVNGGAMQLTANDQGWFDQFGDRGVDVGNYVVGVCGMQY